MKKLFLAKIEITDKVRNWNYYPGDIIIIPVLTNSKYNVERIIGTRYWGSEYPNYKIISIDYCDDFLFKPLL